MKIRLLCFWLVAAVSSSHLFGAVSKVGFGIGIEPIVGYERIQKLIPTPHFTQRLVYGARATAGLPLISAEAEYLRGTDTEFYSSTNQSITDTADKAKLGLRSSVGLGSLLRATARAGVQATQNKHEEITAGVVTTSYTESIKYAPYAGAGLRLSLSSRIYLTAELVAVFTDTSHLENTEYQATAGFVVRFP
jgi:hypothetical protein